ncbi:hypothetical protein [Variovorax sp. OAS795]|uniref:hypothetical protein n=1 Tax=Variovorax sp. OAS795 TaxID=3034231 RepID=UPI00339B8D10
MLRLDPFKKSGSGFSARCPAHQDRGASLSMTEGEEGRVLPGRAAGWPLHEASPPSG